MVLLLFNEPEQNYEPLLADKIMNHCYSCMVLLSLVYTDNDDIVFPPEASKQQSKERIPSHQSRKRERFEEPDTGIVFQYFSI